MEHTLLFVYLLIAIGFSFLCSVAEAVLLSITPSYLAQLRKEDTASSRRVIGLKENIDRPLSAILSLNTIAHTVGATGVGAQAVAIYGDEYVGIISAILTLLILVFSEIIPKTIGAMHWRALAGPIAIIVQLIVWFLFPLVWISERLTKMLSHGSHAHAVTRAEIAAMAELGAQEGLFDQHESNILRNLLKLKSVQVEDIMTPRTVVIAFDQSQTIDQLAGELSSVPVSRIPIYEDRRDMVTGFVLKSELLGAESKAQPLAEFSRSIMHVQEDDSLTSVFGKFLDQHAHIAIVTDRFGGMEGIVTMEDIMETLLDAEIVDEMDQAADLRQVARSRWKQRLEAQGKKLPESTD